jgi:YD repeat-containing protein
LTQITYPDLTTETFSYDNRGNVSQKTNAFGTTTFTYNEINQMIHIAYPDSNSVLFEYDNRDNCILMIDQEGYTSYIYDNRSRILSKTRIIDGTPYVFIDQYTGKILGEWVEEGVLACSPAFYDGKVYLYSLDGFVRCISFLEGKCLWKAPISRPREKEIYGFRLWPSPTVADGKVYIGSIEGVIYCLDAETGEILWTCQTGGEIRSAPAVVDGKVLVSSTDGKLYCFGIDPDTYLVKAQNYLEEGEIEKAQQFLAKASFYVL